MHRDLDIGELASAAWFRFRAERARYQIEMQEAIENDNVDQVERLLDSGYDVNTMTVIGAGFTALMYASTLGRPRIVEMLLGKPGINVNAKNRIGYTALMDAVVEDHAAVVEELLKKSDIDVNAKNKRGQTALILAFVTKIRDQPNIDIVKSLVKAKADPTAKDVYGKTALMIARPSPAAVYLEQWLKRKSTATIIALTKSGMNMPSDVMRLMEAASRNSADPFAPSQTNV